MPKIPPALCIVFRRGGALLGGMVFRYRTRSACPGQNGYHYRVRCTGPSPPVHAKTIIPASHLWPKTTAADDPGWTLWKYHNFQPFQTFKFAGIARGNNIKQMIRNTQAYQSQLVATAAESYRRQRYQPVTALFQFMFVETALYQLGVVDYLRKPKAGYFALKRAYQPILPSIEPVTAQWMSGAAATLRLWAINDTETVQ